MTRLFWPGLLLALSLILGPWLYQRTFCACDDPATSQTGAVAGADQETPAVEAPDTDLNARSSEFDFIPRFTLADGLNFRTGSPDNFSFKLSGALPNLPDGFMKSLQEIADYLKNNPSRMLSLTGLYAANEVNNTDFENLGLARADAIKAKLIELGAPATSFQLGSMLSDQLNFDADGILNGGVNWEFIRNNAEAMEKVDEAKALEELGKTLKARPITVYFETNKTQIIRTDELNNFLKDAKAYVEQVPGAKFAVTGHADSRGSDAVNNRLASGRANAAKAWLQRNGIASEKITTDAKGSKVPVASNDTESGRARNRRAEIIIVE